MKRLAGSRIGLVTMLAALLAAAGTAFAFAGHDKAGDKSSRDAKIKAAPPEFGTNQVSRIDCDAGKRVVGGGALATGSTFGTGMRANAPMTKDGHDASGWYADVRASPARDVKIFVICSRHSDATIVKQPFPVSGDEGSTTVNCPSGSRALSGGVSYAIGDRGAADVLRIEASGPLDGSGSAASTNTGDVARKWFVDVGNPTGPPLQLTAFAVCSKKSKAKLKVVPFTVTGEHESATAACAHRTRAIGGGFVAVGSTRSAFTTSGPRDETSTVSGTKTGDVAREWHVSIDPIADVEQVYKVAAICG